MSSAEESDDGGTPLPTKDSIMAWSKTEMEDWLFKRHLPKTASRKEVLANRILRHMLGDESEDDDESDEEQATNNECQHSLPICPGNL